MDDLPPNDHRPDRYTKQREKIRREHAELDRTDTMLLTRPANEWHLPVRDRKAYSEELFGPLWRVGEVALLFGPRGLGKSILAVQIAESIARGRPVLPVPRGKSPRRGEKVLYVDMQRSEAQWAERYTQRSPIPGKPPRRYRFSRDLLRAGIDLHLADPDAYRKDPHTYAQAAIGREIEGSGARIVIVDDILLGGANAACQGGLVRTMQTMRHWAMYYEISILIVAGGRQRRRPGPVTLADIAGSRQIADSVFALAPSTFGPQYRYIKHLASASSPPSSDEVLTLQFGSNAGILPANEEFSASSKESCIVHSESCIFLGPSDELAHLVDYAAEALRATRAEERQRRRRWKDSSKDFLIDGILDGSYTKYLKGE